MSTTERVSGVAAVGVALAASELAVRALSPRPPAAIPPRIDPLTQFTAAQIKRGKRYSRPQLALGLAGGAAQLGLLTMIVRRRAKHESAPDEPPPRSTRRELAAAAATAAALTVQLTAIGLPLSALSRRRALRAGLATGTWRTWGSDQLKSTAIEASFAGAGAAVTTALARRWPSGWWLPAAGGSVLVGAGLGALGPIVLDPLFSSFDPLPEGELRDDVLALARDAGVTVGGAYSIDASRRTNLPNAYVNGLGPSRRVVLFDTLINNYTRDELRFVVAHELGHVRYRDMPRLLAFAALSAPATAFAVQRVSWSLSRERGTAGAVPALLLSTYLVSAPLGVLVARLSRAIERRTDRFALSLTHTPEAAASLFRQMALQGLRDLDPPRWLTAVLATHPSTSERIAAALLSDKKGGPHGPPQ